MARFERSRGNCYEIAWIVSVKFTEMDVFESDGVRLRGWRMEKVSV